VSHDSDPLLRAVQTGDQRCPDGAALAGLGRIAREAARPPKPVDLRSQVLEVCRSCSDEEAEAQLIDEIYDDGSLAAAAAAPELARLGERVRSAARPPREVDLLPRLEGRLAERSSRRLHQPGLDSQTSWRIWTAVVVGHVAALLTLAVFNFRFAEAKRPEYPSFPPDPTVTQLHPERLLEQLRALDPAASLPLDAPLPEHWSAAIDFTDLLELRERGEARASARRHYRMEASAGAVRAGLNWLLAQRDPQRGTIGPLLGKAEVDLSVQGLAALALLGEGLDDERRRAALRQLADWLVAHPDLHAVDASATGIAALALIEAGSQLDDERLHAAAAGLLQAFAERSARPLDGRGASAGFLVLAVRAAEPARIAVPEGLRRRIARFAESEPDSDSEMGLVAVQALARLLERGVHGAGAQRAALVGLQPGAVDGRGALFADCFVTLALREFGGRQWWQWSDDLQRAVLPSFRFGADGQAWVPGERLAHAEALGAAADCFATSLTLITLQAPYRYLPLAL